ncbi:hypothetical protein AaE_008506, partial [Aphanomyces astaci]
KMRTGWSDKQPLAHKLVPKVQSLRSGADFMNQSVVLNYAMRTNVNVDALTIHGRSRLQRYSKSADWVYVEECANAREAGDGGRQMALIGGGDVLSYEEFHQHLSSGVLDTCMLARGALIKPWLPTEIKERRHFDISASERLDLLKDFVKFGMEHWGSDQKVSWSSCRNASTPALVYMYVIVMPRHLFTGVFVNGGTYMAVDWIKISEMLLGPVPEGFQFVPKHKANAYA